MTNEQDNEIIERLQRTLKVCDTEIERLQAVDIEFASHMFDRGMLYILQGKNSNTIDEYVKLAITEWKAKRGD